MTAKVNSNNYKQFVLNNDCEDINEGSYITGVVEEEGIGFRKPVKVSKELCGFLKLNHNDKYTRNYITGEVVKYIKNNCLEDELKNITPDDKLAGLLEGGYNKIEYIRLCLRLNKHFIKD